MTNPAALAHLRHELRTPLNHIIGYAEMLLEDSGSRLSRLAGDLRGLLDDARQVLAAVNERLAPGGKDADSLDLSALGTAVTTPLGRIMAATDRLAREATAAGAEDALPDVKRIAEAARRLAALVIPASATASEPVIPPDGAGGPGGARVPGVASWSWMTTWGTVTCSCAGSPARATRSRRRPMARRLSPPSRAERVRSI